MLSNKGKVKYQDKEAFWASFEDLLIDQNSKTNRTKSLYKKEDVDNHSMKISALDIERKKSFDYPSHSFGSTNTKLKSHDELTVTNEEAKRIPKQIMNSEDTGNFKVIASNEISKHLSDPLKLISGYDLSFKDIDRFIRTPIRQSSSENCPPVTVGDIQ